MKWSHGIINCALFSDGADNNYYIPLETRTTRAGGHLGMSFHFLQLIPERVTYTKNNDPLIISWTTLSLPSLSDSCSVGP